MRQRFEDTKRRLNERGTPSNEVLRSVAYVVPEYSEEGLLQSPPLEAASIGVELHFDSGSCLALAWHMVGKCHGLVVGDGPVEALRDYRMTLKRREPVSKDWKRRVGNELGSVRARWHISDGGCPPTVWAVELSFGPHATLIGLGELRPAGPVYMPDELVIGFGSEALAGFEHSAEIEYQ